MGVIYFPMWPVFCFVEDGRNAVLDWLDREAVASAVRLEFQARIDFIKAGGPNMVPGCIRPVPKGRGILHYLQVERKGFPPIKPLLCYGPFSDTEITILAGAPDRNREVFRPADVITEALRAFDAVSRDRQRRRYERVVNRGTTSRF